MPCRPGISSMSLGRCYAGHSLEHKLSMAAKHGIEGIELFFEDLVGHANGSTSTPDLLAAAESIHELCISLNLEIIALQPFMHYEGLKDRSRHAKRIDEIKVWMQIAHVLGTDVIQIPSSFLSEEECSDDIELIVSDLRELADLGAQQSPVIRFAYESLGWATHIDRWEQCWDIVQRVDRTNFGICLDTFNILARIYADPAAESGCLPGADEEVQASMQRMVQQIGPHKDKIFFIQVVDAERLAAPLLPGHAFYNSEQPARMSWSRNCRLFYGERQYGAYLPVQTVLHAMLIEIGFEGWVSMELFNRVMERKDNEVVEELASRAAMAWERVVQDFGLDIAVAQKSSEVPGKIEAKRDSGMEYEMEPVARL